MVDTLFWHNSEVSGVMPCPTSRGCVQLVLSAGAVERQQDDASGRSTESGFLAPLVLMFEQAQLTGPIGDCLGSMAHGELRLRSEDARAQSCVTLPWHCDQALILQLQFRNGSTLQIEAASARCVPTDDARFRVSYAC
ncbi:MAG: hypothetical protein EPO09_08435 [Aquabacterium sp.]|uniref:hypothetical protein n=1 Tax=Aquabacterium sp. TaxID=1872578 RepID=UPI0012253CDC|nr:hypothetical protein [Aquabacterium sp.]TAK95086.1 MAG: hypothetical protein EPO09_08435 [Aquabacterium sp.]